MTENPKTTRSVPTRPLWAPARPVRPSAVLAPPSGKFAWPTLPISLAALCSYMGLCLARGVGYGLGCKADGDGRSLAACPPQYLRIDCSGWVRAALAYATDSRVVIPDGSVNQNDWCRRVGLKRSSLLSLLLRDGTLRMGFIRPSRLHPIGHVYLCLDGQTLESWGGHGPGRRSPLVHVLQAMTTDVYVLSPPAAS